MALLVYIANSIKEDIKSSSVTLERLERSAEEIVESQSTARFDRFPPPCLTWKKIYDFNNRLVAAEKRVGDHLVILFLRLLVRSSSEYDKFKNNCVEYIGPYVDKVDTEVDLNDWVKKRLEQPLPPPPPQPSSHEAQFLWAPMGSEKQDDVMIMESAEWVRSIAQDKIKARQIMIPRAISTIAEGAEPGFGTAAATEDNDVVVAYWRFPTTKQVLLVEALYAPTLSATERLRELWTKRLQISEEEEKVDLPQRNSVRSYPALICYDPDMWVKMETGGTTANLALSPEEAEVLLSAHRVRDEPFGFPLFINGRAGSGKSTILQYLFAQHYFHWLTNMREYCGEGSHPLYFACSAELVRVAKEVVKSLLNANSRFLVEGPGPSLQEKTAGFNSAFREFHAFLYSLLPDRDRATRFSRAGYVSYARFRKLWLDHFGKEPAAYHEHGPHVAWHVIRSYIKGASLGGELDASDYDTLTRDEKSISRRRFESVQAKVWDRWYRVLNRDNGLWDDQDLVRHVIDGGFIQSRHCAVFCDEAQDFTRLEVEAIYRLSLFSQRSLVPGDARLVPFAFAGDPFQTLNPTGFRWEALKAAFTERIMCSLLRFMERRDVPDLNYRELRHNYRSTRNVVHVCNSIQAVRAVSFGLTGLQPQDAWQFQETLQPATFFPNDDAAALRVMGEQADVLIIVPCEEGEEAEYVERSSFLRTVVRISEDGTPQNVYSPARAKGLEFNRVVLFGFGSREEAGEIFSLLNRPEHERSNSDDEDRLPLEYFMNGLYVAASRAKKRLFVIDQLESFNRFWKFAVDEDALSSVVRELPQGGTIWRDQVGCMARGLLASWSDDRDKPEEIAKMYEVQGRATEQSYDMRQAAVQYEALKNILKAKECRAWAYRYDKRFRESGWAFYEARLASEALRAFWDGGNFPEIVLLCDKEPNLAGDIRCRASGCIAGAGKDRTYAGALAVLREVCARGNADAGFASELTSECWRTAIQNILDKLPADSAESPPAETWVALSAVCTDLRNKGVPVNRLVHAGFAFKAGRYNDVLSLLDSQRENELYRVARLQGLLERDKNDVDLASEELRLIADHLLKSGSHLDAAERYHRLGDFKKLEESVRMLNAGGRASSIELVRATGWLLSEALRQDNWQYVVDVLAGDAARLGRDFGEKIIPIFPTHDFLMSRIIPLLASSDAASMETGRSKQPVFKLIQSTLFPDTNSLKQLRTKMSIRVIASAVERVGRDIDALQLYERVFEGDWSSEDEKEFARKRWVRCKKRQAQREEAQARRDNNVGLQAQASEHREEANNMMRKYNWSEADLGPEILFIVTPGSPGENVGISPGPAASQVTVEAKGAASEAAWQLGELGFRYFADRGRVNLESSVGDIARLDLTTRSALSEDVVFRRNDQGALLCDKWGLSISFEEDDFVVQVMFQLGTQNHTLRHNKVRRV